MAAAWPSRQRTRTPASTSHPERSSRWPTTRCIGSGSPTRIGLRHAAAGPAAGVPARAHRAATHRRRAAMRARPRRRADPLRRRHRSSTAREHPRRGQQPPGDPRRDRDRDRWHHADLQAHALSHGPSFPPPALGSHRNHATPTFRRRSDRLGARTRWLGAGALRAAGWLLVSGAHAALGLPRLASDRSAASDPTSGTGVQRGWSTTVAGSPSTAAASVSTSLSRR